MTFSSAGMITFTQIDVVIGNSNLKMQLFSANRSSERSTGMELLLHVIVVHAETGYYRGLTS